MQVLSGKMNKFLTASRRLTLGLSHCVYRNRGLRTSSVPTFPDPPCGPVDPKCHHVQDLCQRARQIMERELPQDKYIDEMLKKKAKCCVVRFAHKVPCVDSRKRHKKKDEPEKPFRSMWEPPCQPGEQPYCKDFLPRFDEIYYKPTNKCRCYQRTWVECPPVRLRMKKICCLDGIEPPEVIYRIEDPCPSVACELDTERMRRICAKTENYKCVKVLSPCCPPARCVPSCFSLKTLGPCNKLKAPYPAFSESKREWQRPKRYRECSCYDKFSQCEAFAELKRKDILNIPLKPCEHK